MEGRDQFIRSTVTALVLLFLPAGGLLAGPITDNSIGDFFHDSGPYGYVVWHTCPESYANAQVGYYDFGTGGVAETIPGSEGSDRPDLSGSRVVWAGWMEDDTREIFWSDLEDPAHIVHQITEYPEDDSSPVISQGLVAWMSREGLDYDIFYYDIDAGIGPELITFNYNDDNHPQVSYPFIVWYGWDDNDWEIYAYDITMGMHHQITDNSDYDVFPQISGSMVVWYGWDGNDWEIFFYDILNPGMGIIQVTNNDWNDGEPVIETPFPGLANVAWYAWDGEDWEIWAALDLPFEVFPIQVTYNTTDDYNPRIAEAHLTWYGWDGEDWEIFFTDFPGDPAYQLTHNELWDQHPSIQPDPFRNGYRIVWEQFDGEDYEIRSQMVGQTDVPDSEEPAGQVALSTWSPNPLRRVSSVSFSLHHPVDVEVSIFNILGERVTTLAHGPYTAGTHTLFWDGTDSRGRQVASGVYFSRLVAGDHTSVRCMVVIR